MNMKMNNHGHSSAVMAMLLLVAAVLACSSMGDETGKANELVNEGNAAVQEAKKYVTDAEEKKQTMLRTKVAQLAEARTLAKEVIASYDKAEAKVKEAAQKYEDASKLKIKDKFNDYLALKEKEYNKRAEIVETAKSLPQALLDSESRTSFISRANATNEKVNQLTKEADDIGAEADKLQKDNPDSFKS